jgi:deoxyadenosine/deoxycytidine kinase
MKHYFITIAGNIGVGKSTLVELLTQKQGWEPVYEAVAENPYLADFYDDMRRWSFHSQVFFLSRRLQQHHALMTRANSVLQDRSVYEDAEIFARNLHLQGNMSDRDWAAYYDLFRTLTTLLPAPDLVIYLRASVPVLQRRIAQRGRDYERRISAEYLAQLNTLYDDWVNRFALSPVLTIETDHLNYVRYDAHLDLIWTAIENRLHGKDTLTLTD